MNLTAYDYLMTSTLPIILVEPLWSDKLLEIAMWCRDYQRYGKFPVDVKTRFAIGFYQIYQGIDWKDKVNRNESFASAFIHLMCCAEKLEIPTELHIPEHFENIKKVCIDSIAVNLLRNLSKTQQQLFYSIGNKTQRASKRLDFEGLTKALSSAMTDLIALIEPEDRKQAVWDATSVMTKELK